MRKAVFVYQLHGATPAVETKLHDSLIAAEQFTWTGIHSTWEYVNNGHGVDYVSTLFSTIVLNFGTAASNAGATKWKLRMWGADDMQEQSAPRG